jgi:hypothetical protein
MPNAKRDRLRKHLADLGTRDPFDCEVRLEVSFVNFA